MSCLTYDPTRNVLLTEGRCAVWEIQHSGKIYGLPIMVVRANYYTQEQLLPSSSAFSSECRHTKITER